MILQIVMDGRDSVLQSVDGEKNLSWWEVGNTEYDISEYLHEGQSYFDVRTPSGKETGFEVRKGQVICPWDYDLSMPLEEFLALENPYLAFL
jgi:hypothetical protein